MRIGIVTFWWAQDNYGQLLQAYALYSYLRNKGHEVFLIRLRASRAQPRSRTWLDYADLPRVWNHLAWKLKRLAPEKQTPSRDFDLFREQFLEWSEAYYETNEDFSRHYPAANAFICGSDQVWNLIDRSEYGKNWFLNFSCRRERLISYAASFGKDTVTGDECDYLRALLVRFQAVSVREAEGVNICTAAGRRDAVHVVDPALLLSAEDYQPIVRLAINSKLKFEPMILGYFLNLSNKSEVAWSALIDFAKRKELPLNVIPAGNAGKLFPKRYLLFPSIPEWLKLYETCCYVVTNSFHGTVFAILMKKPFLVFPLLGNGARMNGRIHSLLKQLRLESRIYRKEIPVAEQLEETIDWRQTERYLMDFRQKSEDFLSRNLMHDSI